MGGSEVAIYANQLTRTNESEDNLRPPVNISNSEFTDCLKCDKGQNCRKCRQGVYQSEADAPVLVPLSAQSAEFKNRRRKSRFFKRCSIGLEVATAAGYVTRCFTLTESDYAIGNNLDFGEAAHKLFTKMRYDYGQKMAYFWVEHRQGDKLRLNRHVLCYGTHKLDVFDLDHHWHKVYGSKLTGMEKVWSPAGLSFYLAKYLNSNEGFVRAFMSQNWVFLGWWKFNLDYHIRFGVYPTVDQLARLAIMTPAVRTGALEWMIETGYLGLSDCLSSQQTVSQNNLCSPHAMVAAVPVFP
jgi:hypothetical protein